MRGLRSVSVNWRDISITLRTPQRAAVACFQRVGGSYNGTIAKDGTQALMVDELNPRILSEWLAGMPLPERARTLNRIAHDLTICTRDDMHTRVRGRHSATQGPGLVIKGLVALSEL